MSLCFLKKGCHLPIYLLRWYRKIQSCFLRNWFSWNGKWKKRLWVYLIRQILNHITGYFHWAQTLKFGGMQQWKKTSYSLTNQEFSVIINFQSIKTNLDSCQISSKFSFIITFARWVFFWRFSHKEYMVECWYSSWYWESYFELLYFIFS